MTKVNGSRLLAPSVSKYEVGTEMEGQMNGAQSLVKTLVDCGVDICFANPGTSEMHFVAALDSVNGLHPVLCLFEGVATGAADGYGRIAGKPAATLMHLGPGLANGLANLHNARRAATPVVNIVGDHATYHLQYDAPLTSDIVGFARPVSSWIHESKSAKTVAADAARAVQAARAAPGGIATLILPADTAWNPADRAAQALPDIGPAKVGADTIEAIARLLSNGKKTAMLLRGTALIGDGLEAAGRVHAKTGVRLMCDNFAPHSEPGAGRVTVERIPYFGEQITAFLAGTEQIDPGRQQAAGLVLRLSRQAELVRARGLRALPSRAPARGRRQRPAGPRRRARRARQACAVHCAATARICRRDGSTPTAWRRSSPT